MSAGERPARADRPAPAYTYLDAKNTSKAQATRLINRSRHNLHVSADWRVNRRWSQDTDLRAGILNLANRTFLRSAGNDYGELGRRFYVSLNSRF